ncbi:MAG TPA: T9SS type A sorting domain-containing protein [Flavipsychrobacter sp.]|nr:T9SS type A sorting domain-containing protein [Flavipsychrobacter sp.]
MKYLYLFLLALIQTPLFAQVVFKNYDISPGADSSTPGAYTNCNGKMYFIAKTQAYGYELWAIDSSGNTQMLTNNITKQYDAPQILGELNGKLVFTAFDTTHGNELWISDGTPANTKLLKDIYPGKESGIDNGTYGCLLNGKIYFSAATAANGNELWATDGTDTGTHLIADIHPGAGNANPVDYNTINGKIFFWANDGTHYHEPWVSDGTQAGTMLLKDINPTGGGFYYNASIVSNGLLYFWAQSSHSSSDVEVWVTDGTTAGTIVLENRASHGGAYISKFVAYKNKVYYWNHSDTGLAAQLWVTDGTNAGTHVFSNAAPNTYMHCSRDFLVFKDKLYFTGGLYRTDTMSWCELWVTDGTDAGTKLVADLGGKYSSTPSCLTSLGDYIYFIAQDSDYVKLYQTDGTTAGTRAIAPYNATNQNALDWDYVAPLHLYNNKLWMRAAFTNTGMELWSIEDMFPQGINTTTNNSTALITLYPNPAHHNFTLNASTAFKAGSITLTDVTGRVVMTGKLYNNEQTISLQGIAPGIYMADVWLDDKRSTQKLVIE